MINNDRQQVVQGITVKGFSQELLDRLSENKDKVMTTVAKHFLNHKSILSIEETHKLAKLGRYIVIVYKKDFVTAQAFIANFYQVIFPTLYDEDERDKYRVTYQSLPHLVDSPSAGGAVGVNGKHLDNILTEGTIKKRTTSTKETPKNSNDKTEWKIRHHKTKPTKEYRDAILR
jgi:hypothetical protein